MFQYTLDAYKQAKHKVNELHAVGVLHRGFLLRPVCSVAMKYLCASSLGVSTGPHTHEEDGARRRRKCRASILDHSYWPREEQRTTSAKSTSGFGGYHVPVTAVSHVFDALSLQKRGKKKQSCCQARIPSSMAWNSPIRHADSKEKFPLFGIVSTETGPGIGNGG